MRELSKPWIEWCREMHAAELRGDYRISRGIFVALWHLSGGSRGNGVISQSAVEFRQAGFPSNWIHEGRYLFFPELLPRNL